MKRLIFVLATLLLFPAFVSASAENTSPDAYKCTGTSGGGTMTAKLTSKGPFEEGAKIPFEIRACEKYIFPFSCDRTMTFTAVGTSEYMNPLVSDDIKATSKGSDWTATGTIKLIKEIRFPEQLHIKFTVKQTDWRYIGLTCWTPTEIWNKSKTVSTNVTWKPKGLDTSRGKCSWKDGKCKNDTAGENCWKCDDQDRDKLEMNWAKLNQVTQIKKGQKGIPDGRYIYVLPKGSEGMVEEIRLRRYDRFENAQDPQACKQYYKQFTYDGNYRDHKTNYLHVRHSQLNGGWDSLFSAGEMKVWKGKVEIVNNESGHFKPPAKYPGRACQALWIWGVTPFPDYCGTFEYHSAALTEDQCTSLLGSP